MKAGRPCRVPFNASTAGTGAGQVVGMEKMGCEVRMIHEATRSCTKNEEKLGVPYLGPQADGTTYNAGERRALRRSIAQVVQVLRLTDPAIGTARPAIGLQPVPVSESREESLGVYTAHPIDAIVFTAQPAAGACVFRQANSSPHAWGWWGWSGGGEWGEESGKRGVRLIGW
ncbi:MAG: hypothetical protein WBO24_15995 [Nitrospirales bacterium]